MNKNFYEELEKIEKNISDHVDMIKDEIYDRMSSWESLSKVYQHMNNMEHRICSMLSEVIAKNKNDVGSLKGDLRGLREELWYQTDHTKFVNLINNKFSEMNEKFKKYIYEPNNHIYTKESETNEGEQPESEEDSNEKNVYNAKDIYNDMESMMLNNKIYESSSTSST